MRKHQANPIVVVLPRLTSFIRHPTVSRSAKSSDDVTGRNCACRATAAKSPGASVSIRAMREAAVSVTFFSQHAVIDLPSLSVRALVLPGTELSDTRYLDTETIEGTLQQQYRGCMSFFKRNLVKRQTAASFNSPGTLEVSETVLEELLVNALVHRDLLIRAPIRVFIFSNRIEIISPGSLPENQTVETPKLGSTLRRNPVLAQHAERLLPFLQGRGVGHFACSAGRTAGAVRQQHRRG